ncbi:MAG: sulfotransferase domain-containing protein, partial [Pseudomonadota bacterium]
LEAMTHRRGMKSHTPMDGLPLHAQAQYICVFRHPLDAHFSFRNHVRNIPLRWFDHWYPEDDPNGVAFRRFLDGGAEGFDTDVMPLAHILRHYQAAKELSKRPNVSMFHFADMKADLAGTFAQVSTVLGISHAPDVNDRLVEAATFEHMKRNAQRYAPTAGQGFFKSDSDFFKSGDNGQWHGKLTDDEIAAYDAIMDAHLAREDRLWLEGGLVGG